MRTERPGELAVASERPAEAVLAAGHAGDAIRSAVGKVAGTEDSTPLKFHVAISPNSFLQLDDVVITGRDVPGVGPVSTSGVVTEVVGRHEGAVFGSDVFLIADGVMPAHVKRSPRSPRPA